jgi:hypothetical protein
MENRQGMQVHGKCAKSLLAAALFLVFACDRTKTIDSGEVHVHCALCSFCCSGYVLTSVLMRMNVLTI